MAHSAAPMRPTGVFGQLGVFGQRRRLRATWALSRVSTLGRHTLPSLPAWKKSRKRKLTHQAHGIRDQMVPNGNQHNPPGNRRPHHKFQRVTPNGGAPERRRPRMGPAPQLLCQGALAPKPASRVTLKWPRNGGIFFSNADCPKHTVTTETNYIGTG